MAAISRTELANVIADMIEHGSGSAKLAKEIAGYLVAEHKTKDLDIVMRDVMTARAKRGIVEADITTAFPLSNLVKNQVNELVKAEYPQARRTILRHTADSEVLTGVKVRTHDKQLDETARGKLDRLQNSVRING